MKKGSEEEMEWKIGRRFEESISLSLIPLFLFYSRKYNKRIYARIYSFHSNSCIIIIRLFAESELIK